MSSGSHAVRTGGGSEGVDRPGRTPAELFCKIVGPVLILAGLVGFIVDATFDTGGRIEGEQLLGLEVNGWHNIVHLASGAFLLAMARNWKTARTGVLAFAGIYALVTIWGLVDGDDVLGIVPVNPADNGLHIVLTLAALAAGLLTRPRHEREPRTRAAA